MAYNSPELAASLFGQIESSKFDKNIFEKTGLFVLKGVLPKELVKGWRDEWDEFYKASLAESRNVNMSNPVDLKETLPGNLATIYKNAIILDFVQQVFGENIALYNHRFVIKDKFSPGEVFLHYDSCYHLGYLNKASFFVPLGYAGKKNGGVTFYPGTHKYGYLGDAGEIDPGYFKEEWAPYTPELEQGDIAIMNSTLWHKSGINEIGVDRIVADIIYQPANDPSGKELLRGQWQTDIFINRNENPVKIFKRSRVTKIIDLEAKSKAL